MTNQGLLSPNTDDYHFSFSLAVLGESAVGKSRLIQCTLPAPHDTENAESDPAVDHGVRCRSHTYESRGARYQILMWEVPGATRYLDSAARYATMAAVCRFWARSRGWQIRLLLSLICYSRVRAPHRNRGCSSSST